MKKKHPEHVNLERWLVSYADFITLLFAFFVIMYAISQADIAKFKQVSSSLKSAFSGSASGMIDMNGNTGASSMNIMEDVQTSGGRLQNMPAGKTHTAADMDPDLQSIKELLEEAVSLELGVTEISDTLKLEYDSRGLIVRIAAKDFFPKGEIEVKPDLRPLLDRIGRVLAKYNRLVRIEGHTDASEYPSGETDRGWGLSAARASWVAQHWLKRLALDPKRIGVAGYSHYRPLSKKQNEWGQASNRRIEIIVLNNQYESLKQEE